MLAYELKPHAFHTVSSVSVIFIVNVISSLCIDVNRLNLLNPVPLELSTSQTQTTGCHFIVVPQQLSKWQ
jgi:hypothetical protein